MRARIAAHRSGQSAETSCAISAVHRLVMRVDRVLGQVCAQTRPPWARHKSARHFTNAHNGHSSRRPITRYGRAIWRLIACRKSTQLVANCRITNARTALEKCLPIASPTSTCPHLRRFTQDMAASHFARGARLRRSPAMPRRPAFAARRRTTPLAASRSVASSCGHAAESSQERPDTAIRDPNENDLRPQRQLLDAPAAGSYRV